MLKELSFKERSYLSFMLCKELVHKEHCIDQDGVFGEIMREDVNTLKSIIEKLNLSDTLQTYRDVTARENNNV